MQIEFHRSFRKRYKAIPENIRRRFNTRLILFEKEQFNGILNNHSLGGDRKGQWSINITGDWRAIYIYKNDTTVIFIDIDTHSNLYQ